jgi:hypothetical protein
MKHTRTDVANNVYVINSYVVRYGLVGDILFSLRWNFVVRCRRGVSISWRMPDYLLFLDMLYTYRAPY